MSQGPRGNWCFVSGIKGSKPLKRKTKEKATSNGNEEVEGYVKAHLTFFPREVSRIVSQSKVIQEQLYSEQRSFQSKGVMTSIRVLLVRKLQEDHMV